MKRCIYKQSNYLMCDEYIVNTDNNKCEFKSSSGNCMIDEDEVCSCGMHMIFKNDKWLCACGNEKGIR